MIEIALINVYHSQFDSLRQVVEESRLRSISEPPDALFYEHQNVFIKSYLVSACSILEAFIQDLALEYVSRIQGRLNTANLPFNFISWVSDHEKAKPEFKIFQCTKGRKEISDMVSPNYWKTIKTFERVGIDLSKSNADAFKDFITATVEKRNRIVHNNDEALDLSFSDILIAVDEFKKYTKCLYDAVSSDPHIS